MKPNHTKPNSFATDHFTNKVLALAALIVCVSFSGALAFPIYQLPINLVRLAAGSYSNYGRFREPVLSRT